MNSKYRCNGPNARNTIRVSVCLLACTAFLVTPSWAEAEPYRTPPQEAELKPSRAASDNYGLRYVTRELTMPHGMARATFDVTIFRLDLPELLTNETFVSLNFGVAIAPVDNLELGFSRYRTGSFPGLTSLDLLGLGASGLLSGVVAPDTEFGDIPFYIRYQMVHGVADFAIEFRIRIPSATELGLAWGLPLRIHAGEYVAIDTGIDLSLDDPGGFNALGVGIPFDISANFIDNLFFKVQSGVALPDVTNSPIVSGVPLGFALGGTAEPADAMLDLFVAFRFPLLAAFSEGQSEVTTGIWTLTIGINLYSPVLF